jgi:hypothetical protein
VPPAATGTATPTPTSAAAATTIEFQLDDDLIDPGQKVRVTVIARNSAGLEWIEWKGDDTGDPILDDNHRFDGCDQRTECASVWEVAPTVGGRHDLRARARDKNGVRSEYTVIQLRVRDGPTPTPTDTTPTPTPGPGTPTVTPTSTPSVPTVKLQLSSTTINLGDEIEVTVIASHDKGLNWIRWEGDGSEDSALDQQRYDCDNRKDCARTWKVKPTKKGSIDIIADAKDQNAVRAVTARQELRVR